MAERILTGADLNRLRDLRNDLANTIAAYGAARGALGPCEAILDVAAAALAAGDAQMATATLDPTSGAAWFSSDPEDFYREALQQINLLATCLDEPEPAEPDGGGGGGGGGAAEPPALPSSGSGWRVIAGLGLIGLAAYGLWRMR